MQHTKEHLPWHTCIPLKTFCDMQHTKKTFETKSKDEMTEQTKNQILMLEPM
jgi:hypothetical protein